MSLVCKECNNETVHAAWCPLLTNEAEPNVSKEQTGTHVHDFKHTVRHKGKTVRGCSCGALNETVKIA